MTKLWQKNYSLNKEIEKFTVGNDYLLDQNLVKYDVYGSIAHAVMLNKIGILTKDELSKLKKVLVEIFFLEKKFQLKIGDEDVHTAMENHLTEKLGDLGRKIHTARSRNDQVLVDIRLYSKENLLEAQKLVSQLADSLVNIAEKHKEVPMPGYTHSRKAMPSSVGLYFGSFAESLTDDLKMLKNAYELNNQCPLGSGAGYGLPLNVNRQLVADLLGFKKVQNNSLYVQNSRGKFESAAIFALSGVMGDLARISHDLIIFSMDEFGYFKLPDEFCTGSSIMPQKKNPDVLELIRAKSAKVDSNLYLVKNIISKLQSGYNRDLQLTKEPLMESFEITLACLKIFNLVVKNLQINKEKCASACTQELFAAEHAYELVKKGVSFREAYKKIAEQADSSKKWVSSLRSKSNLFMQRADKGDVPYGECQPEVNDIKDFEAANLSEANFWMKPEQTEKQKIKNKKISTKVKFFDLGLDKLKQDIKSFNAELDSEIKKFKSKMEGLLG